MIGPLVFRLTHKDEDGRPVVVLTETMHRPEGDPVPAGFQTDFFSIPCPVIEIWPAFAPGCEYAVGHDWDCHNDVDKAVRSLRLYNGLISAGVNPLKARIIYLAVLEWPGSELDLGVVRSAGKTQRPGATRSSDTPGPGFHH